MLYCLTFQIWFLYSFGFHSSRESLMPSRGFSNFFHSFKILQLGSFWHPLPSSRFFHLTLYPALNIICTYMGSIENGNKNKNRKYTKAYSVLCIFDEPHSWQNQWIIEHELTRPFSSLLSTALYLIQFRCECKYYLKKTKLNKTLCVYEWMWYKKLWMENWK